MFEAKSTGNPEFSTHDYQETPASGSDAFAAGDAYGATAETIMTPTGKSALDATPVTYSELSAHAGEYSDTSREYTEVAAEAEAVEKSHIEVVHLRSGDTHYTVALFEHTEEYADDMRAALDNLDAVSVEQPGHNNGRRRRDHDTAPHADEGISKAVNDLINKPRSRGMIPIDIHQDDPRYALVEASQASQLHFIDTALSLEPVNNTRDALIEAAVTTAKSYVVRDDVLREQLRTDVPKRVGKADVGVALGALHYRALEGIDPEYDSSGVKERVLAWASPFGRLVDNLRDTDAIDPGLLDKAVLAMHMTISNMEADNQVLAVMQPEHVRTVLATVDEYAQADLPFKEKRGKIAAHLRAIDEVVRDYLL